MNDQALLVLCTTPDRDVAERLARALVDARAAACVNVVPGLRSFYRWQGEVEVGDELQLLIKTRAGRLDEVERIVRALHPYSVPELVALPIVAGADDYLAWIHEQTSSEAP